MRQLLELQQHVGEVERSELRGWITREDARFREGMEQRQASYTDDT